MDKQQNTSTNFKVKAIDETISDDSRDLSP